MTELTPYDAYDLVSRGIAVSTDLVRSDQLLGDRTTPSAALHRMFRVDAGDMAFIGKATPGDSLGVRETLTITLYHRYDPGAHAPSYQLASSDLVALLRAVLTRSEFSGIGAPLPVRRTIRRAGHQIEQTVTITAQYFITLPEAA